MDYQKVIDVSDWQDQINYDEVLSEGIKGVIIKISQGTTPSQTYNWHISECERVGIPWGVYCFGKATTPEEAQQEANEVLYLLQGRKPRLGIWYDVEDDVMFQGGINTTALCSAFIIYFNSRGYQAGIYCSSLKCTNYMLNSIQPDKLADYVPWWIADYNDWAGIKEDWIDRFPNKHLAGWQYSDREYIGNTNVDKNYWYDEI